MATAEAPSLKSWLKSTALPLPAADTVDKYNRMLMEDTLGDEFNNAYEYVGALPKMTPAGEMTSKRTLAQVKEAIGKNAAGVLFSGALNQLRLKERAQPTTDYGRVAFVLEEADTDWNLKKLMFILLIPIG